MNYWIFQCNPEAYDYNTATAKSLLEEWNIKQYRNKIKKGDKAIIWFTGKNAGIYAIADITSNPVQKNDISLDNHLFKEENETGKRLKKEDKNGWRVPIDIIHNLLGNPISNLEIRTTLGLETFRAGRQGSFGTNLPSSENEYEIIMRLINER